MSKSPLQQAHPFFQGGHLASPAIVETAKTWFKAIKSQDVMPISPFLSENVRFNPPTFYKAFEGKGPLLAVLSAVTEILGDSFAYRRLWSDDQGLNWCFEFEAELAPTEGETRNLKVLGVDLVRLNPEGLITELTVAVRPYEGLGELKRRMVELVPKKRQELMSGQGLAKL